MQNAKPTTRFFFLLTAYCLLPTALMSRSQPRLCTPVDIRSKKAQKFSLFLTFRPARRDPDVSGLDRQVVSCQADRT